MVDVQKREDRFLDVISGYRKRIGITLSFLDMWAEANPDDVELCNAIRETLTKKEEENG